MIHNYLRPRSRSQPDHQDFSRRGVKTGDCVGPDDHVGIAQRTSVESSIVDAISEDRAIRGDGYHATAGFHYMGEPVCEPIVVLIEHLLVDSVEQRAGGNTDDKDGEGGGAKSTRQTDSPKYSKCERAAQENAQYDKKKR